MQNHRQPPAPAGYRNYDDGLLAESQQVREAARNSVVRLAELNDALAEEVRRKEHRTVRKACQVRALEAEVNRLQDVIERLQDDNAALQEQVNTMAAAAEAREAFITEAVVETENVVIDVDDTNQDRYSSVGGSRG